MLRGAIICPDQDVTANLDQALLQLGHVAVVRAVDHYPDAVELMRLLRASAPQIVFLSTEAMAAATETLKQIEAKAPGVQVIAVSRKSDPDLLLEVMRAGVREFVAMPFEKQSLFDAVKHASDLIEKRPPTFENSDLIFSFLPSKAGVGTSTIAVNVAMALAKFPDTRVGLVDFDLSSGMLRFMLKLETNYCVADAIEHALDMDEELWPQLVTSLSNLDVLHAGRLNPNLRIEPTQVRHLAEFMRRNYRALCFDLSGNLERYSLEIMHESKRIFLVCTPEIPSLHLAREKFNFLRTLNLEGRVSVLVNRVNKREVITPQQIEQILGLPVLMSLPNDYAGVSRAVTAARQVDPKSELGQNFTRLASAMLERRPKEAKPAQRKKFIEYFSVADRVPAK
jgi:pilus assembly protein CpaE